MPKMKTHKGAAKRFKVTGSGSVRYNKQGRRHILTTKSQKRKRNMRSAGILEGKDGANIRELLPYL